MNRAIFLLGGNTGDRFRILFAAIRQMTLVFGEPLRSSSFYLTEPWGKKDQPWFLNISIEFNTGSDPEEILSKAMEIERRWGRERTEKWGPRTLDIDLMYFDEIVLNSHRLTVPHPGIAERKFALAPLAEMCPEYVHPVLKQTQADLLRICKGEEKVQKL